MEKIVSFRAVHRRRASHDVIAQIQDLLISGRIRPGDRLPGERQLAETCRVGRSTVREAYRALEALGVIRVQPGTATCVTAPGKTTNLIPLNGNLTCKGWDQQRQLFEVRLVLDPPIAGLAARRATTGQLETLRSTLREQEHARQGDGRAVEADIRFHVLLFEASGNPILSEFATQVTSLLRESWNHVAGVDREVVSLAQHQHILQAVEARNPAAAEERMREHLESIAQLVLTLPG